MFSHMPTPVTVSLKFLDISCHTHNAVLHSIVLGKASLPDCTEVCIEFPVEVNTLTGVNKPPASRCMLAMSLNLSLLAEHPLMVLLAV